MDAETKKKIQARLKRVAGQVAGIHRMVDQDHYCVDVLFQITAARAALGKVGEILLASHLRTCVAGATRGEDSEAQDAKIKELMQVFDRYLCA